MKYAVVLCDGMADRKIAQLGNSTPMEKAHKPLMDMLASKGEVGMVKTIPESLPPGSDVANMAILGYNPEESYTGRSSLEAAGMGIALKPTDVTFRCNLVTLSDEAQYEDKTLIDYCSGDISTEEAHVLVNYLKKHFDDSDLCLYPGVSYRHCLVWNDGDPAPGVLTPPHDITGKCIKEYLPCGRSIDKLYGLMIKSYDLLKDHPINVKRIKEGKNPANSVWFWGTGTAPHLESFKSKYNLEGSVISAVDLLKGIAECAGMGRPDVPGATGYVDTNFEGKLHAAVNELKSGKDFVYIHLEAPDECGHRGEIENKIKSIELIDELIIAPLIDELDKMGDYAVLICPDHPTPIETRTHAAEPVPYLIYRSNNPVNSGVSMFCEESASHGNYVEKGYTLIERLIK